MSRLNVETEVFMCSDFGIYCYSKWEIHFPVNCFLEVGQRNQIPTSGDLFHARTITHVITPTRARSRVVRTRTR